MEMERWTYHQIICHVEGEMDIAREGDMDMKEMDIARDNM